MTTLNGWNSLMRRGAVLRFAHLVSLRQITTKMDTPSALKTAVKAPSSYGTAFKRTAATADYERVPRSRFDSAGPPRLVLRFAIYAAVALALAAAAVLVFTRTYSIERAERTARFHAGFVSDTVLRARLRRLDFQRLSPKEQAS